VTRKEDNVIWRNRFGGLPPSRREIERDIDEELALHLEMRAKDFEREGLDPDSAGKKARRRFGDLERFRGEMMRIKTDHVERIERVGYWDEILQDIRFGLRQLMRKPALPLMIIALLAIGIGANTAVFSVVKAVLLDPLPYAEPDRLLMLWSTTENGAKSPVSYPDFKDWQAESRSFEDIGVFHFWHYNLSGEGEPERVRGSVVSAGCFEILGVPPQLGRTLLPEEDQPGAGKVVLISDGLWKRRYGADPKLLGQTLLLDGQPYTVIGIMPPQFDLPHPWTSHRGNDLWLSIHNPPVEDTILLKRDTHFFASVARLKADVSLQSAHEEMVAITKRLEEEYPKSNAGYGIRIVPLHEQLAGRAAGQLLTLLGAAGLVLLIVCGNVAGLLMAKATTRQREVALRSALGAGRMRLVRQLFAENVPLTLMGGGLGFLLALWGIEAIRPQIPPDIARIETIGFDAGVFGFTLGISLVTGVLFSTLPAWASARLEISSTLKQGSGSMTGAARARTRNLLLIGQFATTLVLAHAAALMLQSYVMLSNQDYGFEENEVLTAEVSIQGPEYETQNGIVDFYDGIVERVQSSPGVRYAAAASKLPLMGGTTASIKEAKGHDFGQTQGPDAELSVVTSDYFQAMGIPLLEGRKFTESDRTAGRFTAIINETMADELWPNEDPIGKQFSFYLPFQWTVVGVVGDVRQWGPEDETLPEIYMPMSPLPSELKLLLTFVRYVVVRTNMDPSSAAGTIRQAVADVDAHQPISDIRTTADILGSSLARRRFNTLLIGIFATIALLLITAGIYGVMSFFVVQRTHEIGIRMALGSSRLETERLVLGQALTIALIGVAAGLVGVFATTKLTESMVYEVSPTDPATLIGGIAFLVGVGFFGSLLPALRASRVDPILALRDE
jgi:predicted permease